MFFFFSSRRRHTRFKCDWSSDVCSSDLQRPQRQLTAIRSLSIASRHVHGSTDRVGRIDRAGGPKIGRASCRARVEISVVAVSLQTPSSPHSAPRYPTTRLPPTFHHSCCP